MQGYLGDRLAAWFRRAAVALAASGAVVVSDIRSRQSFRQ
jgi:hypothetical protein